MSKSLGNVVSPGQYAAEYGVDAMRYFLLRDGGVADDGDFSEECLRKRVNGDLADNLGNLGVTTSLPLIPVGRRWCVCVCVCV